MVYSKGISWIDDTRIPFVDAGNTKGRFTPNLLVCDDMLNDGSITSKGKMKLHRMSGRWGTQEIKKNAVEYQGDKGTNSRYYDIDLWFDKMIEGL